MAVAIPPAYESTGIRRIIDGAYSMLRGALAMQFSGDFIVSRVDEKVSTPQAPARIVVELAPHVAFGGWNVVDVLAYGADTYDALINDLVPVDVTSGDVDVRLPPVSADNKGGRVGLSLVGLGTNTLRVIAAGADKINGSAPPGSGAPLVGTVYVAATLVSNGVDGWVFESLSKI